MPISLATLEDQARRRYAQARTELDRHRSGRFVLDILRGLLNMAHHLSSEPIFERAAALSYGTLLSVVPLLGVVLGIVGIFGHTYLREGVHDAIFTFLAPGIRKSSQEYLEGLIDRTTGHGVMSLSFVALLFTAMTMLRSVEINLNKIWGVQELRTWRESWVSYLSILIAGPVLLGISLAATAALQNRVMAHIRYADTLLAVGPVGAAVLGLFLLYTVAPNAPVKKRAALAGALVAAVVFEAAKHAYAYYTSNIVHYNVIYGSLGAIPLFLVWVYLSWIILLFGARLSYSVQNAGSWGAAALPYSEGQRSRLAARTVLAAVLAERQHRKAPSIHAIAEGSGLEEATVAEATLLLLSKKILRWDGAGGLVPAHPPDRLTLAMLAEAAKSSLPSDSTVLGSDPASRALNAAFLSAELAGTAGLAQVTLQTLAERAEGLATAAPPAAPAATPPTPEPG